MHVRSASLAEGRSNRPLLQVLRDRVRTAEGTPQSNEKRRSRNFVHLDFGALRDKLSSPLSGNKGSSLSEKEWRKKRKKKKKLELEIENVDFTVLDFDKKKYVQDVFINNNWTKGHDPLLEELTARKQSLKTRLQNLVTDNYEEFISLSKLIGQFIDQDIADIGGLISDMKKGINAMKKVELVTDSVDEMARNQFDSTGQSPSTSPIHSRTGSTVLDSVVVQDGLLELEAAIQTRDFAGAISLVNSIRDKLTQFDDSSQSTCNARLEEHMSSIESLLVQGLQNNKLAKKKYVNYLGELKGVDSARREFLRSCSSEIQRRLSHVRVTGDALQYTTSTSFELFHHIQFFMVQFKQLFNEQTDMAAFTQWTLEELTQYCSQFKTHVFTESITFQDIGDCINAFLSLCLEAENSGLTVRYYVERMLTQESNAAAMNEIVKIDSALEDALAAETWSVHTVYQELSDMFQLDDVRKYPSISRSVTVLIRQITQFVNSLCLISDVHNFQEIVERLIKTIERYMTNLYRMACGEFLSDAQFMVAIGNVRISRELLVPDIKESLQSHFHIRLSQMDRLVDNLDILDEHMVGSFARIRADTIINDKIGWGLVKRYPTMQMTTVDKDERSADLQLEYRATKGMRTAFVFARNLANTVRKLLPDSYVRFVLQNFFDAMSDFMNEKSSPLWTRIELSLKSTPEEIDQAQTQRKRGDQVETDTDIDDNGSDINEQYPYITVHDLNQIIVDISFFQHCTDVSGFLTERCRSTCESIISDIVFMASNTQRSIPHIGQLITRKDEINRLLHEIVPENGFDEQLCQLRALSSPYGFIERGI